jgi:hypothetical protein
MVVVEEIKKLWRKCMKPVFGNNLSQKCFMNFGQEMSYGDTFEV